MRARLTAAVSLTSAALLAVGLAVAPAALADNYAPELPPASTGQVNNPTSATPIGPPNSGVVITAADVAPSARVVDVAPPAAKKADAPTSKVPANRPVAPVVSDLPAGDKVRVTIDLDGEKVDLGKVKVNSDGTVTLPAMRGKAGTTMTVQMTDSSGKSYYVNVTFAKKKRR